MEDVLFAASPDDPPIVTEVAPPLGINDTTPDSAPRIAALRAALSEGGPASTTARSPEPTRADVRRAPQVRTVPMAAPVRDKERVDRDARTNTARARVPSARPGPNDTSPVADLDLGIADTTPANLHEPRRSRSPGPHATTNQPLVVSRHDDEPRRSAPEQASSRARRRKWIFGMKLLATAFVLGGAAVAVTTLAVRAPRDSSAASRATPRLSPLGTTPSPAPSASASEPTPALVAAVVTALDSSCARPARPALSAAASASAAPVPQGPPLSPRRTPPRAPPAPSAIPFE